jgi:HSP20 family protein
MLAFHVVGDGSCGLEAQMATKKEVALERPAAARDPFALVRRMTAELDRMFEDVGWPAPRWPAFRTRPERDAADWMPQIDVFDREGRLVTKIDLPGIRKEDIKVEVIDGHLTIAGERKSEVEEKKENVYRCEREYGSFYRTVPLPEGVKLEDVKAVFADGVLEVIVPLPAKAERPARSIAIEEAPSAGRAA